MKKFVRKDPVCKRKKSSFIRTVHLPTKVFWNWGKLRDLHYELLEHLPYCPDLAPSNFRLFPKLTLFRSGLHFSSNQEANAAVEGYFADLTKNHYRDKIMALEYRWHKCISLKGDYVEKQK
jgi:hypothetical protein